VLYAAGVIMVPMSDDSLADCGILLQECIFQRRDPGRFAFTSVD
jgi:hypothetical protein